MCTIEQVDRLAHYDHSLVVSLRLNLGLGKLSIKRCLISVDYLLESMWEHLGLVRVYTKKKGHQPSFDEPLVLTGYYLFRSSTNIFQRAVVEFQWMMLFFKSIKICLITSNMPLFGEPAPSTALKDVAWNMSCKMKMFFKSLLKQRRNRDTTKTTVKRCRPTMTTIIKPRRRKSPWNPKADFSFLRTEFWINISYFNICIW